MWPESIMGWWRRVRKTVFTDERPTGRYIVLGAADDEDWESTGAKVALRRIVEAALGEHYFEPNWRWSYYSRGEDLNMARVFMENRDLMASSLDHRTFQWWQTHVRGWIHEDGTLWLHAHDELAPLEHPREHLAGTGYDDISGIFTIAKVLDHESLPYGFGAWNGESVAVEPPATAFEADVGDSTREFGTA